MTKRPSNISVDERLQRLDRLRAEMERQGLGAVVIGPTTNLRYFAGISWHPSERFTGAVITPTAIIYICPGFERDKVQSLVSVPGDIRVWQEDENPYALIANAAGNGPVALDDQVALFTYFGLRKAVGDEHLRSAGPLTSRLRRIKSGAELALMQHAKNVTLEVQRRAHDLLRPGILVSEVIRFI